MVFVVVPNPPVALSGPLTVSGVTIHWSPGAERLFIEGFSWDHEEGEASAFLQGRRLGTRVNSILSGWAADVAVHGNPNPKRMSVAASQDFVLVGSVLAKAIYILTDQEYAVIQPRDASQDPSLEKFLAAVQKVCGMSIVVPTPADVSRINSH